MDEKEDVEPIVKTWLLEKYPESDFKIENEKTIKEIGSRYPRFDFYVRRKSDEKIVYIVECKGSKADLYSALGQCMCYYKYCSTYPLYLAIPTDYSGVIDEVEDQWEIDDVNKIMARNDCKFGLLLVSPNGHVAVERRPTIMSRAAIR